jgi:hypothetical protein
LPGPINPHLPSGLDMHAPKSAWPARFGNRASHLSLPDVNALLHANRSACILSSRASYCQIWAYS